MSTDPNNTQFITMEEHTLLVTRNIQLKEEIQQYKQKMKKLQSENTIVKQKGIILKQRLDTCNLKLQQEKFKKQKELDTMKLQFEQKEQKIEKECNNKLNELKQHSQNHQQTIRKIQVNLDTKTSKYTRTIKSLKNGIRASNMKIDEMEKNNRDLILMFNEEIAILKHQICSKDAEIHSLQMITPVKCYDVNIANPYNYRRKRSSGIRKILVTSNTMTIDTNERHRSSWRQSESHITPFFLKQRTSNGSISVSSPSCESPYTDYSDCFMEIESNENKSDENLETC